MHLEGLQSYLLLNGAGLVVKWTFNLIAFLLQFLHEVN